MISMILFDVDGVLLSEERYFDASALTVWEMLYSPQYLGLSGGDFTPSPSEKIIRKLREEVFVGDQVLDLMKTRGINSNWDMVYLSFAHQLLCIMEELIPESKDEVEAILQQMITLDSIKMVASLVKNKQIHIDYDRFIKDYQSSSVEKQDMLTYLNEIAQRKLGVKTDVFSRNSDLWELCMKTFQEWYLGDELVEEDIGRKTRQVGKKGFLNDEIPIVPVEEMAKTFSTLQEKGITLGIGTGRPTIETLVPLKEMGLLPYFDRNRVVTASHVLEAENEYPQHAPLAKPQPYCYIKGWLGLNSTAQQCFDLSLPFPEAQRVLIVGDSVADFMAAKSMGCRFAAVLTGLSGQDARNTFEELGADLILNDMREVVGVL